jgi:hypothetical protein
MSTLPKIDYPSYNINIPSLNKKYPFRPFLVKEEKLLLMAKESQNQTDILTAIKQVVNNCSLEPKLNIGKLALFDLEYIFLQLRTFSVDNMVKVAFRDSEDGEVYEFDVDLNKVELKYPESIDNNIKISSDTGIIMKYPSASIYDDKEFMNEDKELMFELIVRCVEKIYKGEEIYETKDFKKEDLVEFLEGLSVKTFADVQKFLLSVPKLEYIIEYKNKKENNRKIVLSSLNDFFTWR